MRGSPLGVKFRRQHPVGRYVIDFYCAAAKTGFEIDGIAHAMGDRSEKDAMRDALLAEAGISVVRIAASDALRDPQAAAAMIVAEALKRIEDRRSGT